MTSAPGATNLITPMMNVLADKIPMIVFCGQVATSAIGTDGFQEANVLAMSQPCTKWNTTVDKTSELPNKIDEAFEIALSGRTEPGLVELPIDVTAGVFYNSPPTTSARFPPGSSRALCRLNIYQESNSNQKFKSTNKFAKSKET